MISRNGLASTGSHSNPQPEVHDHELFRIIGQGAYGDVWLARNVLGEYRAVKVVWRRAFSGDDRPFEREFEGIKRFEPISRLHPSQLAILHVGKSEEAGYFYYVMELADDASAECGVRDAESRGTPAPHIPHSALRNPHSYAPLTLRRLMRDRGPMPAGECLEIGRSLASALAHLHAQGLVHRDVKPSNVIFVRGIPKLADIGLVTTMDEARSFVGTEGYVPPEGPGSTSADCYALGKLLYELSTGNDRTLWPEPAANLATRPDRKLLLELNSILHCACATHPRERYQSAEQMHVELTLLESGRSIRGRRAWQRRTHAMRKIGLAAMSAVVGAGALLSLLQATKRYGAAVPPPLNQLEGGAHGTRGRLRRTGPAYPHSAAALWKDFAKPPRASTKPSTRTRRSLPPTLAFSRPAS